MVLSLFLQRLIDYEFSIVDLTYSPFLLFIIFYFARSIRDRHILLEPEYKYFLPGLSVKILGALMVAFIYNVYYSGGDTNYYFFDGRTMSRLLFKNFVWFGDLLFDGFSPDKMAYLDSSTGFFVYYRNAQTFFVVRVIWPFVLFGLQAMIPTALLFSVFTFGGVWRMFKVFILEFPVLEKSFALAFFFVPSVFFWGSGILKDSITFSSLGYFFYSYYFAVIKRQNVFRNTIIIFLSLYVIVSIKPYIFVGILPGSLIWVISTYTSKIKGSFIRGISYPIILIIGFFSGYFLLMVLSDELGKYSLERVLEEAVVTNKDLKSDYYKGNSFDIGEVKPTIESMLEKSPAAINAALFRPYITESNNVLMFISGLENLFTLLFTIYILFRVKVFGIFAYFNKHHLLTFSLIFSLFFAFSVGISTSNFGSLVRYRIPLLPYYIASLIIIKHFEDEAKKEKRDRKYTYYEAYG